jgi:exopolyphosphatase/pppGpp-phosphohydrolase
MTPMEIRRKGYGALVNALGVAGTIRFLQQFDIGHGDYTKERHQWLDEVNLEEFLNDIKQLREEKYPTQNEVNESQ